MGKRMKILRVLAAILAVLITLPSPAFAQTGFTPAPATSYASSFIQKCEGQTWFMDEIERLLNQEQKTLNRIASADDLSRIRSIGLRDKEIEGKIPTAIGELKNLRYLFLSGNRLSGTIPVKLFSLPLLENVDLSGNLYEGDIPAGFGEMPALSVLMLKNNQYTGTIPGTILSNTNITMLDLTRNKLSGGIPAAITGMTSLKYLGLSENALGGTIPDLSSLKKLTALSLQKCGLTGEIPESIYQLTDLSILDLGGNGLEGEISPSLANLTKLRCLILSRNKLRGVVPDAFHITAVDENNAAEIRLDHNYLRGMVPKTLETAIVAGATVELNDNYMTGEALSTLEHNRNNFADKASGYQHQLTSASSTVRLSTTGSTNIYTLLKHERTDKEILRPDEYTLAFDEEKVSVEVNEKGIFLRALTELPSNEKTSVAVYIKDNSGSDRSKAEFTVTTDSVSGGSSGGGGGGGGFASPTYTITVDDESAIQSSRKSAPPEEIVTITVSSDAGISVTDERGLQIDVESAGRRTYAFRMPHSDVRVALVPSSPVHDTEACLRDETCPISPLIDASTTAWYHDGAHFCIEKGYMKGTGMARFEPGTATTRATIVTILYRMEGSPDVSVQAPYPDVANGSWYGKAVQWADHNGIIKGYGSGMFGPNDPITREQFATILYRYATYKAYDTSAPAEMKPYADRDRISSWALTGMKWANTTGLIQGRTETMLAPATTSTRAEAATLIFRFCKNMVE